MVAVVDERGFTSTKKPQQEQSEEKVDTMDESEVGENSRSNGVKKKSTTQSQALKNQNRQTGPVEPTKKKKKKNLNVAAVSLGKGVCFLIERL